MKKIFLFIPALIIAAFIYSNSGTSLMNTTQKNGSDTLKKVCISTSYGDIKIKFYNGTPLHRDNFIKLTREAFFDGTLFHRVIQKFMIQGGDPDSKSADSATILGNGGPAYTIPAEIFFDTVPMGALKNINIRYSHKRGALGAARDDNPSKASSGSQFYIVQGNIFPDSMLTKFENNINATRYNKHFTDYLMKPENLNLKNEVIKYQKEKNSVKLDSVYKIVANIINQEFGNEPKFAFTKDQRKIYETVGGAPHLDGNYTVFGEVYEGMDVVDKIAALKVDPTYNRPKTDVKMTVKVIE